MKKTRKLVPAIALLLISALLLSTASYAWFSMNTTVTAQGMQVKAEAEGGIVISNSDKSSWGASAESKITAVTSMLPTSTANLTAWFHGTSTDPSSANAGTNTVANNATSLTLKNSSGLGYFDENDDNAKGESEKVYYLASTYYVKSTTATALATSLYIKDVTVTANGTNTTDLNGALRVAIKYGESFTVIYGSTASSTSSYYVGGQTTTATTITPYNATNTQITGVTSIPNTDNGAVQVQVYVWFEGEDVNCLSNNIAGLSPDTLSVAVRFSTTTTE